THVSAGLLGGQWTRLPDVAGQVQASRDIFEGEVVGASCLPGGQELDEMRVRELGRFVQVVQKLPDDFGPGEALGANELQSSGVSRLLVPRLEHDSCAAFPQALHEQVWPHHQFPTAATKELIDLIGR